MQNLHFSDFLPTLPLCATFTSWHTPTSPQALSPPNPPEAHTDLLSPKITYPYLISCGGCPSYFSSLSTREKKKGFLKLPSGKITRRISPLLETDNIVLVNERESNIPQLSSLFSQNYFQGYNCH